MWLRVLQTLSARSLDKRGLELTASVSCLAYNRTPSPEFEANGYRGKTEGIILPRARPWNLRISVAQKVLIKKKYFGSPIFWLISSGYDGVSQSDRKTGTKQFSYKELYRLAVILSQCYYLAPIKMKLFIWRREIQAVCVLYSQMRLQCQTT